eukprot:4774664-Karenia_brevis.AAC.1
MSFVIKFSGNETVSARRNDKFLQSMRKSKTEWHKLYASDTEGASQLLSVGADKSKRMLRTELANKKLKALFESACP